jgi:hypothetical protein
MMDGNPPGIFIGYYRWHSIVSYVYYYFGGK